MAPRKGKRAPKVPKSVQAVAASVSKKAKAATSTARVTFGDGEKVQALAPVPAPSPIDNLIRERLERERGTDALNQYINQQIMQVVSMTSQGPHAEHPFSAGPRTTEGAIDYLRDSAIEKDYPAPDPQKARVITTSHGVYHLPSPTSLPTGARVTVPLTARAVIGNARQFVVGVQGPGYKPAWQRY